MKKRGRKPGQKKQEKTESLAQMKARVKKEALAKGEKLSRIEINGIVNTLIESEKGNEHVTGKVNEKVVSLYRYKKVHIKDEKGSVIKVLENDFNKKSEDCALKIKKDAIPEKCYFSNDIPELLLCSQTVDDFDFDASHSSKCPFYPCEKYKTFVD